MYKYRFTLAAVMLAALSTPAPADMGGKPMDMGSGEMSMPDAAPHFKVKSSAYTADHRFLVKLISMPSPIPFEKHFDLRFAVYDGRHPDKKITDADLKVMAGMRHGMKHGFAHGMESSPKVEGKDGVFTASGMYFTMMGTWVIEATVQQGNRQGTAEFSLPCCDQ